jgi:histidinol-phosphate aminotransferase
MNRRSFVQTLSVGAAGLAALEFPVRAAAQTAAAKAAPVPAAPAAIRIGSNENPYGPAASAIEAIAMTALTGNRYPGQWTQTLTNTIAQKFSVPPEYVLLSGGSGDILKAVVYTYTSKTRPMVTGLPSYEAPTRSAQHVGAPLREVALTSEQRLNLSAMATRAIGAGLVYICNPNNPTSTVVPAADVMAFIEKVAKTSPTTRILVDEAYFEYADHPDFGTVVPLVMKYPQLIVARTFSKIHAMAGVRVGYAIANPKTLEAIKEYHSASGMSVMSLAAANASLLDIDNMERNRALNREVRKMTVAAFETSGFTVAPCDANFVFVNIKRDSRGFQEACRQKGVQIGRAFPPMTNWARISIGTMEEMEKSIPVFMDVLGAPPVQTASFEHLDRLPSELT